MSEDSPPAIAEQLFVEMLKKGMGNSPFDDANVIAYADHGWNAPEWRAILPILIPKFKTYKNGRPRYGVGNSQLVSKLLAHLWQRGLIGGDEGWYRMDTPNHPYYPGNASVNDPWMPGNRE